jgi:hypothetical protein
MRHKKSDVIKHSAAWPADFDGHSAGHRLKDLLRALD